MESWTLWVSCKVNVKPFGLSLFGFSDEEDFSKGINSFIQSVIDRRKARKSCDGPLTEDMVGVENRIIGCATFEKKYV